MRDDFLTFMFPGISANESAAEKHLGGGKGGHDQKTHGQRGAATAPAPKSSPKRSGGRSNEFKGMAQRLINAEDDFVRSVSEQFGYSPKDARKIMNIFLRLKAMKASPLSGKMELKHGALWEAEPMKVALDMANGVIPIPKGY